MGKQAVGRKASALFACVDGNFVDYCLSPTDFQSGDLRNLVQRLFVYERIRGVAVSTQIVQTLLEHEWVRIVGYRDVPGRPAMYATTRQFLDYFNLNSLEQLPPLSEIRDLDEINRGLALDEDKPQGRILEFPVFDGNSDELEVDAEEAAAAAIGTRPMSEILGIVDSQLGIKPESDSAD